MTIEVAVAADNSPSHKTRRRIVGSSLESRNSGVLPVGLLTCASTNRSAFPSSPRTVTHIRPVLHAYSGGAVLEFHQLPKKNTGNLLNESRVTANGRKKQDRLWPKVRSGARILSYPPLLIS